MIQGKFVDNLPKVYGLYTGGFVIFIILMAILEAMGVSAATIGILFVAFTIFIYAAIGWLSRTMAVDAYYVAGREKFQLSLMVWLLRQTGCLVHLSWLWQEVSFLVVILIWLSLQDGQVVMFL